MRTQIVVVVCLMVGVAAYAGPDPNYLLTLSDGSASDVGDNVTIFCGLDFAAGSAVAGASWGVCSDAAYVTVNCVGGVPNDCVENGIIVPGEALAMTNGGTGPQFFAPATTQAGGDGWTIGIVVNLLGGDSLSPQDGASLAEVVYEVVGLGVTEVPLTYCTIGSPLVSISVGITGGGDVVPTVSDGVITLPPPPNPYALTMSDVTGSPGDSVAISCGVDFMDALPGEALSGGSWGVCSDPTFVTVGCLGGDPNDCVDNGIIVPGTDLAMTNGGAGPDFFSPATTSVGGAGWNVAFVVGADAIPPTASAELTVTLYDIFDIDSDVVVPLTFCEIGDPVVPIAMTPSVGDDIVPLIMDDGSITITGKFSLDLTCVGGVSDAHLMWVVGLPFDYFALHRNGDLVGLLDGRESEFLDENLAPGSYHYELIGVVFPDLFGPPVIVVADCDADVIPVTVASIEPVLGYYPGGETVTITGTGFLAAPDTAVTFGPLSAQDVNVIDDATLTCITPAADALGSVDVTVANALGTDTVADGFLFGFIRGEVNGDGKLGLPDALAGLEYLFSQGAEPPCLDAVDFDDDALLELGDPLFLLNYLFAMGAAPFPPFRDPGLDPTPDDGVGCI